jgi:hypothetical protein
MKFHKYLQKDLIAVGFEPTPVTTGALNQRLRPLGHATSYASLDLFYINKFQGQLNQLKQSNNLFINPHKRQGHDFYMNRIFFSIVHIAY